MTSTRNDERNPDGVISQHHQPSQHKHPLSPSSSRSSGSPFSPYNQDTLVESMTYDVLRIPITAHAATIFHQTPHLDNQPDHSKKHGKRRRLAIELHRIYVKDSNKNNKDDLNDNLEGDGQEKKEDEEVDEDQNKDPFAVAFAAAKFKRAMKKRQMMNRLKREDKGKRDLFENIDDEGGGEDDGGEKNQDEDSPQKQTIGIAGAAVYTANKLVKAVSKKRETAYYYEEVVVRVLMPTDEREHSIRDQVVNAVTTPVKAIGKPVRPTFRALARGVAGLGTTVHHATAVASSRAVSSLPTTKVTEDKEDEHEDRASEAEADRDGEECNNDEANASAPSDDRSGFASVVEKDMTDTKEVEITSTTIQEKIQMHKNSGFTAAADDDDEFIDVYLDHSGEYIEPDTGEISKDWKSKYVFPIDTIEVKPQRNQANAVGYSTALAGLNEVLSDALKHQPETNDSSDNPSNSGSNNQTGEKQGLFASVLSSTISRDDGSGDITSAIRRKLLLTVDSWGTKHFFQLDFETVTDARSFYSQITMYREEQSQRFHQKMKSVMLSSSSPSTVHGTNAAASTLVKKKDELMTFLIEIVSAWDLPAADISIKPTSDPFVRVFLNGVPVHRTAYLSKTLDPIWTLHSGSLFILTTTLSELVAFAQIGLQFQIYDYDTIGSDESLGVAYVNPQTLYNGNAERIEYQLQRAIDQPDSIGCKGYMAIRCRRAKQSDIEFMSNFIKNEKIKKSANRFPKRGFKVIGTALKNPLEGNVIPGPHKKYHRKDFARMSVEEQIAENQAGGKTTLKQYTTRYSRKDSNKNSSTFGEKLYLVRPTPDPKRINETKWMTKEQIDEETSKESHHWLDIGSGQLGNLFIEILSCDRLPEMDTGIAGNKTDCFVQLVFEDTIIETDIIDDCLSPRFLPWSKRAFVFHIMHPSSNLLLGIFDFDGSPIDNHDLIGRVAISVANFRPDTLYVLKYPIFDGGTLSDRENEADRGILTIRLRLEIKDHRKFLLGNLQPVPSIYVNVKDKKSYVAARQTFQGKIDTDRYNRDVIMSYVEELTAYKFLLYHLEDAVKIVLLWRGTFRTGVKFRGEQVKLPLTSVALFISVVLVVERPTLLPSFCFAVLSYTLCLAVAMRNNTPSRWTHCKHFHEFLQVLVIGKSLTGPDLIEANENLEEYRKWKKELEQQAEKAEEQAAHEAEEARKRTEEQQQKLDDLGVVDEDISTKTGGRLSIDPLKPILYPIQQYLGMFVRGIRFIKYVLIWEECYFAFWVSFGCSFLAIICLFVPWMFILRWTARITVWSLLGPWMKFVDIFYFRKLENLSEEELEKQFKTLRKLEREKTADLIAKERVKKEDAAKKRDIKTYMFGNYILRVPILKMERYRDNPLPESTATPYTGPALASNNRSILDFSTRIQGQYLSGAMIPEIGDRAPVQTQSFKWDACIPDWAKTYMPVWTKTCSETTGESPPDSLVGKVVGHVSKHKHAIFASLLFVGTVAVWWVLSFQSAKSVFPSLYSKDTRNEDL